jgi:hypothetical protein
MANDKKYVAVHFGGSNRKGEKQVKAFHSAGIELLDMGQRINLGAGHMHWSNRNGLMEDTPAARALLKQVGGAIRREQPDWVGKQNKIQESMFKGDGR